MEIEFVGTSHGICEKDRYCSCAMVKICGNVYLIDAGAPITDILQRKGILFSDIKGIFITHNHFDHIVGLVHYCGNLDDYKRYEGIQNNVYVPSKKPYRAMYRFLFGLRPRKHRAKIVRYKKGVIIDDGILKVTAIPVKHILHSFAFMLEAEGKRVLFSGDLAYGMRDFPKVLFEKDFDLLVLEGAHTLLDDEKIIQKIQKARCKKLLINHIFDKRNTKERLEKLFSRLDGKECGVAQDDMKVSL